MTHAAARSSSTNGTGATHGASRSPFQQAERAVRSQLGHGLSSHAIEHNPRYRALRGQAYRIAREIAIEREREAIAAAAREGRPCPAIIWAENRPTPPPRRLKFCSNCNREIKRDAKHGRCRHCAQRWVRYRGTRERTVEPHELEANAARRAQLEGSVQCAPPWDDPSLQFAPPDARSTPHADRGRMPTIAEAKAQLADGSRPATPLELIPDAKARGAESTRQTFERVAPHLPIEVRQRLRALPAGPRGQLVKRIVDAERRKEHLATTSMTPSPRQRRRMHAADAKTDLAPAERHITEL